MRTTIDNLCPHSGLLSIWLRGVYRLTPGCCGAGIVACGDTDRQFLPYFIKLLVETDNIAHYRLTIRVAPGHHGGNAVVPIRNWVTKKLRPGDMTALAHVLQKRLNDLQPGCLDRLALRGFIKTKANYPVITPLGRVALLLRRLTKH